MKPFVYQNAESFDQAVAAVDHESSMAVAGGTTMVDLMKLNVLTPQRLVHVRGVIDDQIQVGNDRLRIGAACTMADLAEHEIVRTEMPVIRQSLILAATPQIRNMATIGGNLLQQTRSTYFRHLDMTAEGPGTDAGGGGSEGGTGADTSLLAILGNAGRLVGLYAGDFAIPFSAFGGTLNLRGPDGPRSLSAADFYRPPTDTFQYTTALRPHELIESIELPRSAAMRNSFYFKVRERSSYAFALVSAAVGLEIHDGVVADCRVGLGGVGSIPWHAKAAEDILRGHPPEDSRFETAADAALADAQPPPGLEFKVPLAKRALVRALRQVRDHGPVSDQQLFAWQHGRGMA